ncbi:hypothetical protein ACVWZX_002424 [Deinococcus sp. UYEF24]
MTGTDEAIQAEILWVMSAGHLAKGVADFTRGQYGQKIKDVALANSAARFKELVHTLSGPSTDLQRLVILALVQQKDTSFASESPRCTPSNACLRGNCPDA